MGKAIKGNSARRDDLVRSIALIGPNGQLGSDLVRHFSNSGWAVVPVKHAEVKVEDAGSVKSFFSSNPVDVIVNTAALHQVGVCEKEIAQSWLINSVGASNVARVGRDIGAKVIYISTDYVFDGEIPIAESYSTETPVSPLNVYGASKAAGEISTLSTAPTNMVVRVASVFGSAGSSGKGSNFIETIINKAKSGDTLKVVDDIQMSPSYTVDIARKIDGLLEADVSGTFHCSNEGRVTWNAFAQEIVNQVGLDISVEKTETDWSATPKRPKNSSLDSWELSDLGIQQRSWQEALNAYLREKKHI